MKKYIVKFDMNQVSYQQIKEILKKDSINIIRYYKNLNLYLLKSEHPNLEYPFIDSITQVNNNFIIEEE